MYVPQTPVRKGSGTRRSSQFCMAGDAQVRVGEYGPAGRCRTAQLAGAGQGATRELIKFAPAWAFEKLEEWLAFRRANLPDGVSDDTFLFNRIRCGNHITRDRLTKHAIYYIAKQRGRAGSPYHAP